MTLAKAKIDAQKILLESRKTAVFVCLCTVFFKIFLTAALFVSIYSLTILPDFARIWENIYLKILLCLLFSLAAVFSLLFYALTVFSEKRWFYQNTYTAQPLSAFFKAPRIRHIFKITFLFWLRRLLSIGCFLFYLAPFLAGCGGLYYALRTADLPITALYMALGALFCILPLCAYFGFAAVQRFAFCDGLLAENPDCSIVEILGTSKALAKRQFKTAVSALENRLSADSAPVLCPAVLSTNRRLCCKNRNEQKTPVRRNTKTDYLYAVGKSSGIKFNLYLPQICDRILP